MNNIFNKFIKPILPEDNDDLTEEELKFIDDNQYHLIKSLQYRERKVKESMELLDYLNIKHSKGFLYNLTIDANSLIETLTNQEKLDNLIKLLKLRTFK